MTKMFPNEIPVFIPGVKVTMPLLPCEQEVIEESRTVPASTRYTLTGDKVFQEGRDYYTLDEGTVDSYTKAEDIVVGEPVPKETYYEKIEEEGYTVQTKTIYDRYTEGWWVDQVNGEPVNREHPVEINRTVTFTQGNTQRIVREHALALWSNRHNAQYVSTAIRLDSNKLNESGRIFR